jgi:hypothetical protein
MASNLIFKASSIASSGAGDTINLFNTNTTGTINMASNLIFKASSIASSGVGDTINLFSNLTTGALNIGNITATTGGGGIVNVGTGSKCNINIGNATNNSTSTDNGCCKINKLQVGAGTGYRCMIIISAVGCG